MADEPQIPGGPWTVTKALIAIVIIAGMIGIAYVALGAMGVPIPTWLVTMLVIVAVVVVGAFLIKFLSRMF